MTDLQMITQFLPIRWQPYVPLVTLLALLLLKAILAAWAPPAATSRWVGLYTLLNKIALNVGYSANAMQPGRSAVMVPFEVRGQIRTAVADKLGIDREATKP